MVRYEKRKDFYFDLSMRYALYAANRKLGWATIANNPPSPESAFCVFQTQDERNPLLERLGAELVEATESVAAEETKIDSRIDLVLFYPVIVTTAKLYACIYDPQEISIIDGKIKNHEYKVIESVRFRKTLTTKWSHNITPKDLRGAAEARERTVHIVNSKYFIGSFLSNWNIITSGVQIKTSVNRLWNA